MTTAQWERAKTVTADALEQEPERRDRFIADACIGDADVYREVLRMVAAAASSTVDFLSSPPLRVSALLTRSEETAPTFSPDQILAARFRVERFLSRGGMGEVYAATDLELKEEVALKTIHPAISSSGQAIASFKREVSQSRRITHPNVCRVHDMFRHELASGDAVWLLSMELLNGETLSDRIAHEGPLTLENAMPLLRGIISAIAAAHDLGIVHRDLKPSNVMLVKMGNEQEHAVVTDFGLALDLGGREMVDEGGGTPAYMAPEQRTGHVTFATDQFALGLLICRILTGVLPELSHTSAAQSKRQLRIWLGAQLPGPSNFHVRRAISRCLRFRPQDRFREVWEIPPVLDGSRLRKVSRRAAVAAGIAVVIGGAVFAAIPYADERVTGAAPLTAESGMAAGASISADGKWIVYESDNGDKGNLDIWIQPTAGGTPRRLTTDPAADWDPAVSPDGSLAVFRSERAGGGLYLANTDGSGEHLLVDAGQSPVFSRDGRWIAYWAGDRNDTSPSGELYRIPVSGGSAVRLAGEFAVARFPTWSPDGKFILFEGCKSRPAPPGSCADWWVIGADGTGATSSGALSLIRARNIEVQTTPVRSWRRNEVIFSAREGSAIALWALTLSPTTHRAASLRPISQGDVEEREPAALDDGTIIFGRATHSTHVWQLALGKPGAEPRLVTNDVGADGCPSVSRDGRWLFLVRKTAGAGRLIAIDTRNGGELPLLASNHEDKYWPVPTASGDRIAVETRGSLGASIWIVERTGRARRLCSPCGHPSSWVGAERAVLFGTSQGQIAEVDVETGRSRTVLSPQDGFVLGGADWSPVHQYLLFTATRHGSANRTFAARYAQSVAQPTGQWVPISAGFAEMEQPHWSADGSIIYFLSRRDGNMCVWGLRFNPVHGRTVGEPFPVIHYHDLRRTPDTVSPATRALTVSFNSIFINVGEATDAVWRGKLTGPAWLGGFNWRDHLSFLR